MKRRLITLAMLLAVSQPSNAQTPQQQQQLKLLNQLDQMDKLDLLDRLDEAKACANKEDFTCAAEKIKAAKLLLTDADDTKAIASAQAYVNDRITARDERLRREAEARAKAEAEARARAEAEARARAATSSNSSSGCKVISIKDDGRDGNFIKLNIDATQDGSSRFIRYVAVYSDGSDRDADNSKPHYRFGKPQGMLSFGWVSDGFWIPENGDVYSNGLLGSGRFLSNSAQSLNEAIKIYIEDGKYCPF